MKTLPYRKNLFEISPNKHYFCGHSLGPISKPAHNALQQALCEWETEQVCAWTQSAWIDLPMLCGEKLAPIIGAHAHEVVVCDNTTLNIMKLLLCALSLTTRNVILTEKNNFPTDNYIAQSVAQLKNVEFKSVAKDEIITSLNTDVAVLLLSHIDYKTSEKWDMAHINQVAKEKGILIVWDLSHSVGVMKLESSSLDVDFAVGCTYKYLNGGPGAPSFVYVNQKHHAASAPMQGWMGHRAPFDFSAQFVPANGIKRFLSGTPSILSMKTLLGALSLFDHQDLSEIEKVSGILGDYLIAQCKQFPNLKCISPIDASNRGGHVAFKHPKANKLANALIEQGVIVDYRAPDIIRFGISPLYLSKSDIIKTISHLHYILNHFL